MNWLLQNAVLATAAALTLLAVLRRWRPAPGVEHLLWLALAVKFLLPPVAPLYLPVLSDVPAPAAVLLPTVPAASPSGGPDPSAAAAGRPPAGATGTPRGAGAPPTRRTVVLMLALVWLAGAVVVAFRTGAGWLRWRRGRRPGPAPAALAALVREVAAEMGVRPPAVVLDRALAAPLVAGLFRPRLHWPARLLGALPDARARTVVAHELAHLRRRDLWSGPVELAGGVVWWWNPGWHLVRRRLRDAAERACDAAVVRRYPGQRRAYAEALLDVAARGAAGARPALALGVDGPGPLRRRLREILRPAARPASRRGWLAVLLVAVAVLPAWRLAPPPVGADAAGAPAAQADVVAALARAAADPAATVRRVAANGLRDIGGAAAEAVLRRLLDDPDDNVRRVARVGLGLEPPAPNKVFPEGGRPAPPPADTLTAIRARLSRGDDDARLRAAWKLGNLRDDRALDALAAALGDPDFHVRQAAADALGNVGSARAAPALVAALQDRHPRVRQSAASALGNVQAPEAAPRLVPLLSDADAHVRGAAAYAIGHTGGRAQVGALAGALEDPAEHVRMAAASALGALGRGRTP
ncbi:MAG: HEAT repeat domain-containing protein [Gemmatimonadota bacterium]